MPATKDQLKRLEILDELLQHQKWTGDELLESLNNRLQYFSEGINIRTLYRDINYLISEKNAPIHRPEKNDQRYYYTESFSIRNLPLDEEDVTALKKAISILKQVGNFSILEEVEPIISKLENRIHIGASSQKAVIQFERHTHSSGHEHFTNLHEALIGETTLKIDYQPYALAQPETKIVSPYLLKEFRNRWFLLGREGKSQRLTVYALDRIRKIKISDQPFQPNDLFDPATYFNNLIGVSANYDAKPEQIQIKVFQSSAPYIRTKPIHSNQKILKEYKDGSMLIELSLFINYELKSTLLGYGDGIQVLNPEELRMELKDLITRMHSYY